MLALQIGGEAAIDLIDVSAPHLGEATDIVVCDRCRVGAPQGCRSGGILGAVSV